MGHRGNYLRHTALQGGRRMLADGVEIQSTIAWFCCRPGAAECALVETAEKALHLMGPGKKRKREKGGGIPVCTSKT